MIYFDWLIIIFHHYYNFNLKKFVLIINIILYIPKTDDYLKILTDEEVKDFVAINFSKYFKSIRDEWNLRKADKSHYFFLTTSDRKICAIKFSW